MINAALWNEDTERAFRGAGVSSADFAMRGVEKNRRRDAGATKCTHTLQSKCAPIAGLRAFRELSRPAIRLAETYCGTLCWSGAS